MKPRTSPDCLLISLTTLLLAVNRANATWICLLFMRPGFVSAINSINILIMNLDDSTIRLSGFQAWPFVVIPLWVWDSLGFSSHHPWGSASYQHLTHSLSNFLCVVIKWRLSDCKRLSSGGASWVSGAVQGSNCVLPSGDMGLKMFDFSTTV